MTGPAPVLEVSTAAELAVVSRLLARTNRGERDAFLELFDRTGTRVRGLVARVLGPGEAADEVTTRCYEVVWTGEERPGRGESLPWLLHMAHRRAVAHKRGSVPTQRGWDASLDRATVHHPPFPPDTDWLPALTLAERVALSQVYLKGQTHWQADVRLGVPAGTTARRLHEAMLHLAAVVNAQVGAIPA